MARNKRMAPLKEVIINSARDLYNIGLMKEKDFLKIADILTKKETPFEEATRLREERDQEFLTQFKEGKSTGE